MDPCDTNHVHLHGDIRDAGEKSQIRTVLSLVGPFTQRMKSVWTFCNCWIKLKWDFKANKKVLLRERSGIPTAAYQVLHMLPYRGGGYLPLPGGTYPGRGVRYPIPGRGVPPQHGVPLGVDRLKNITSVSSVITNRKHRPQVWIGFKSKHIAYQLDPD